MSERIQVGGDHYQTAIQPIDFIRANGLGFCEGNVVKYLTRFRRKGTPRQDLLKARQYIDFLLEEFPEQHVPHPGDCQCGCMARHQ